MFIKPRDPRIRRGLGGEVIPPVILGTARGVVWRSPRTAPPPLPYPDEGTRSQIAGVTEQGELHQGRGIFKGVLRARFRCLSGSRVSESVDLLSAPPSCRTGTRGDEAS